MTQSPDEEDRRSDEVDAANKSASLTPQDFEAKASFIVEMCPVLGVDEYYQLAISSNLSQAYEDGKRDERQRAEEEFQRDFDDLLKTGKTNV